MRKQALAFRSQTRNVLVRRIQALGLGGVVILALAHVTLDLTALPASPGNWTGRMRVGWYFASGQWRADVKTAAAVFHYLLEPEGVSGSSINRV